MIRWFNPGPEASVLEGDLALLTVFVTIVAVALLLLEIGMRRVAARRAAGLAPPTIRLPARRSSGLVRGPRREDRPDAPPDQRLDGQD
jgi:hypothetical protein